MTISPIDFELPHSQFRPHQLETIDWLLSQSGVNILSAPTGSGKSSYVKAVSSKRKTVVLTQTKSLQDANYDKSLGMDALYGRSNYECIHPDNLGNTADLCLFNDVGMHKCEFNNQCGYWQSKLRVKNSQKISLNYSYWLTAKWLNDYLPESLFLDECHLLPGLVRDWAGCTIDYKTKSNWGLPDFPVIDSTKHINNYAGLFGESSNGIKRENPVDSARCWLDESVHVLRVEYVKLKNKVDNGSASDKEKKRLNQCERLGMKLSSCLESLESNPTDWYIVSGIVNGVSGFLCKPLTAKYHFPRLFIKVPHTVLMSATIGNVSHFAKGLGIEKYELQCIPNQFEAKDRPVYIPKDAPRLGKNSKDSAYDKQADLISQYILDCPSHWQGIIHVNSKYKASELAKRLSRRGLENRVCVIPEVATDKQAIWWENRKKKVKGSVCISWSFHEGVDLPDDQFNFSADTPFPYMGKVGSYERSVIEYDFSMWYWETACTLEQRMGRNRRGYPSHYGRNAEKLNVIFDANWSRVKSYLSDDFMESLEVI